MAAAKPRRTVYMRLDEIMPADLFRAFIAGLTGQPDPEGP